MEEEAPAEKPDGFPALRLKEVLQALAASPYPTVENPPDVQKRASVALIIRINPSNLHWPDAVPPGSSVAGSASQDADVSKRIDRFLDQEWSANGEPELLFIKRASRVGDKWAGHVALPGGRRDSDEDDLYTAIRETREEVGLDLSEDNAIFVGNLPQRLVTSSWGRQTLMVLCPYVFLLIRHQLPPLRLQPSEVAAIHFVSLRSLLDPSLRVTEPRDVSASFSGQESGLKRRFLRSLLGDMLFPAIRLNPSESLYSEPWLSTTASESLPRGLLSSKKGNFVLPKDQRLPLWGLTLGVVADFMELFPPHDTLELWAFPTFTSPDVRFFLFLLSFRFREQKRKELLAGNVQETTPKNAEAGPEPTPDASDKAPGAGPRAGIEGLGCNKYYENGRLQGSRSDRVNFMLQDYYRIVRKSIALALLGRTTVVIAACMVFYCRFI